VVDRSNDRHIAWMRFRPVPATSELHYYQMVHAILRPTMVRQQRRTKGSEGAANYERSCRSTLEIVRWVERRKGAGWTSIAVGEL